MKIKPISSDNRNKCRCYFCGTDKSVKYIASIFDPVIDANNPTEIYICNKCAFKSVLR